MFLVNINGVSDINVLRALYMSIKKYHLEKVAYFQYIVDLSEKGHNTQHLIVDSFHLNIKDIVNFNETELEDFVYDVTEKNIPLSINSKGVDKERLNLFKNITDEVGLSYVDLDTYLNNNDVTYQGLTENDVNLVYDWLDIKMNSKQKFDHNSFLLILNVDKKGDVYNEGVFVGNIINDDLMDMLFGKCKVKHNVPNVENDVFGYFMYEPWAFLNDDVDFEGIIKYKVNLFDKIKNIEPEDYQNCPQELWNALNENSYIRMDDILPIIKKEDDVLNKYY